MTNDDGVKLGSSRGNPSRDGLHIANSLGSPYGPPQGTSPQARLSALRRRLTALFHHCRSHHEVPLLIILPTLYFRLFPLILTHNSITLSVFLAVTLVYAPIRVVAGAWTALSSPAHDGGRKRAKSFPYLLPSSAGSSFAAPRSWGSNSDGRSGNRSNGRGSRFLRLISWVCCAAFSLWVYTRGIASPFPTASSIMASSPTFQSHRSRNATYFIGASFFNNEKVLDYWTSETLRLIDSLGPSNVYVSLSENDSDDYTASKLLHFGSKLRRLHVRHSINITSGLRGYPLDNPWHSIKHRMSYMANLRNGVLEPLGHLDMRFQNVIMLNDVVYHHTDVLKLIAAVGGDDMVGRDGALHPPPRRRMACSLDMDGATLYDTWVLRDSCGRPVSGYWPFFTSHEDKRSVRQGRVLEVGTCWNGIVVLDGDMLLDPRLRDSDSDWNAGALRFEQPPECIISECALLPLSITNVTGGAPIVLDPSVIVAYDRHWWRFYAVWLRMPLVRLWMGLFEETYWNLWWNLGMGRALLWPGLDDGKEMGECVTQGWPQCGSTDTVSRGALLLRSKEEGEL